MPTRTIKTAQDCADFLTGLKLMGTGGGGSPTTGLELLSKALAEGLELSWIDAADLPDEVFSCTTFGSGSISAGRPESEAEITRLGEKLGLENKFGFRAPEMAVRELAAYTGTKIGALVAVELGASNTPAPLVTAARMGIPLVDGDYSGRAVPEDMQTTYFLKDIQTYPAAITDWWGDVLILKEASATQMGERMGKMLAIASHGVVFIASMLLSAKDTRETVVPGTLTLSFELGKAVRQARAAGRDPIHAAAQALEGWELFRGEVTGKEWQDKEGVMVGTTHISGSGAWAGHTLDVWFLNENHIAWLDGAPYVFSPDLIILADPASGEGYTNTEIKAGDPVAVLGAKVYPAFRSQKGIQFFGPRYWGFDIDYVPIEDVVGKG
ncbi:MAG TPA: DUF917 domain-containing protein [Anaerolineales bacterium]|nr:DUF917 domain-containing protein [Anaerolineales bacterium]